MVEIKHKETGKVICTGPTSRAAVIGAVTDSVSLVGANLDGVDLSGLDLRAIDFQWCTFQGANLEGTRWVFIRGELSMIPCDGVELCHLPGDFE